MSLRSTIHLALGGFIALVVGASCGDVDVDAEHHGFGHWFPSSTYVAEKTYSSPLPGGAHIRLRVEAKNGEVTVSGDPAASTGYLTAVLRVGSEHHLDAQQHLDDLRVVVSEVGDEVLVRTEQPELAQGRQYTVAYAITVPADMEVAVTQVNGDVTIETLTGAVAVDAANGTVRLEDIAADASASLGNGAIDGAVTLPPGGEIHFDISNGTIGLSIPVFTSAEFSASAGTGTVATSNLVFSDGIQTDGSVTGTLGAGDGLIELRTATGDITVLGVD